MGRASDRHAADAALIPQCWKEFFSVNFQCKLSYVVCTPQCAITCINICVHVKDPVVHVRVPWIIKNTDTPSMHRRLGSTTLSQLAFPGESNPNFPWKKSQGNNAVVKLKK